MHEPFRPGADPDAGVSVRVVRAGDVAALRRSSPDSAIVALVRSTDPDESITAQLAGADLVLPCSDIDAPDPARLDAARTAAALLADRARLTREQTTAAAHEFAGTSSAVAMAAQLLGPEVPDRRADQLRRLATRGKALAWQAGRAARSRGTAIQRVDLVDAVTRLGAADVQRRGASGHLDVHVEVDPGSAAPAWVDPVRLDAALHHLLDNAARAGATGVTVWLAAGLDEPNTVVLAVIDDGCGLPDGWTSADALTPYRSGWTPPGDGVGLAEVSEFAADHGGHVNLRPRLDGPGVVATLSLPLLARSDNRGADPLTLANDPDWALASILEGIARRDPLADSLESLVGTMERYLPESRCSILLLDQDTETLRHGAGARLPAPYRAAIDGLHIGPLAGSCGTAAYTKQEVVAEDIATDERWAEYYHLALPYDLRSCWSRPIMDIDRDNADRDRVLGTFAVYHAEPWVPDAAALEVVQRLTHVAAVAIGTAALHGRLVESEARFRSTFEAAGLGIALVDPAGTISEANVALTTMAGRPLVGRSLDELLIDEDAVAVRAALRAPLASRTAAVTVQPAEVRVRRPGSHELIWAALSGSLIRGPAGEPRHFCIELFDLTERHRVAQARRERAVAEAADRAKSELLAVVSHEVRTPLHAVIGFAQVLQTMKVSPDRQRAAIEHILGAGRHMLQLINDLIDLTGAETGQLQLTIEEVNADEIVAEATQIVAGLADQRALTMQVRQGEATAARLDRNRLRQVLLNLLGNAIKFTPVGGRIDVVVGPGDILVRDTGDGVPADLLPYLFVPFHRGSNGGVRGADGSGLGLALSQGLMRAMGGDLALVGTSPAGTEFRVVFPVATPPARTRPEGTAPEGTAPEGTAPEATAPEATALEGTGPAGPDVPAGRSDAGRRINSPASMR